MIGYHVDPKNLQLLYTDENNKTSSFDYFVLDPDWKLPLPGFMISQYLTAFMQIDNRFYFYIK